MLQLKEIRKQYKTGDLVQTALDGVSLNLRDNEFVAILGPSGSGKTTMLNAIGGLDRYDSGDLIINGISTKRYKDRDWDSYRNHTIGFVFQSYNLIPHQSVLSNVELALTISGIKRSERRRRAKEALEKVGLGDQLHKRPNQMSGGQMQRVAIARALVNNPDILLADEPTGALDSETSVQVMELLKEVAKDRLVVMVTHNPELAQEYANRIVKLRDGKIIDDSNPYEVNEEKLKPAMHKNMGKSRMSLWTSLTLSFNNLRTKKGRTLLTSFAGSIGIIGIALILSLSNGVNSYITDIQRSTMTAYPISIAAKTMDLSSMLGMAQDTENVQVDHDRNQVYSNGRNLEMASTMTSSLTENNLTAFKKYLDNKDSAIHKYVGENGIVYTYNTKFSVYTYDTKKKLVEADGNSQRQTGQQNAAQEAMRSSMQQMSGRSNSNFSELIPGTGDVMVSKALTDSYDVVYGSWPKAYDELVLVMDENNEINTETLFQLGFLPSSQYEKIMKKLNEGKEVTLKDYQFTYEDLCKKEFYVLPACDTYEKNEDGTWASILDDEAKVKKKMKKALKLKITGIIRPVEDAANANLSAPLGYTKDLTDYLIDYTKKSKIVKAQEDTPKVNVLSGVKFEPKNDKAKIKDAKKYLENLGVSEKAKIYEQILQSTGMTPAQAAAAQQAQNQGGQAEETQMDPAQMSEEQIAAAQAAAQAAGEAGQTQGTGQAGTEKELGEEDLAAMLDTYLKDPDDKMMLSLYDSYISPGSYDDNLESFGVVSLDAPSSINIYADSFEDKDSISTCIEDYNSTAKEEDKITYTDYVALLMSSVTTIVNVITYVLIAFVAISLIVSSIMIGIITYISVLERTKEIGILRAIGASKHNISQVFNAETFIIGLCAGLIGIGITLLLLIPGNAVIHSVTNSTDVNAALPPVSGVVLVVLSMLLTLIGGFIPAKKAAKKDPVTALRTE